MPDAATTTRPKAYSYLRFSTPDQMRGDSFRRQTAMAQDYARRNGLELDDTLTFHDLGISAYRGKNAETGKLADFLEAVKLGIVPQGSSLLVESLDRISRQSARRAVRVLEDIVDAGVSVVTLNDGRCYTETNMESDPVTLLLALLTFIRANEESAMKGQRLAAAWEAKRQKAAEVPMTAKGPAWLRKEGHGWEVIPERGEVVQRIFRETLAGVGQHAIAKRLTQEGVPTFGGAQYWGRSYISKILTNEAVVGKFTPHKIEYVDGIKKRRPLETLESYYPRIVDDEVFDTVRQMLECADKTSRIKPSLQNIFGGGVGRCPSCGSAMIRVAKGPRSRPKLVCTKARSRAGCSYVSVDYQTVEDAFFRVVDDLVRQIPAGDQVRAAEIEMWSEERAHYEEEYASLREVWNRPGPKPQALTEQLVVVEERIATAKTNLNILLQTQEATDVDHLKKRAVRMVEAGRDVGAVNSAIRAVIKEVVIDHEEECLDIVWKNGGLTTIHYGNDFKD